MILSPHRSIATYCLFFIISISTYINTTTTLAADAQKEQKPLEVKTIESKPKLSVVINILDQDGILYCNEAYKISLSLRNESDKTILLPDWHETEIFRKYWHAYTIYLNFPGKKTNVYRTVSAATEFSTFKPPKNEKFRELEPGKTTRSVEVKLDKFIMPGDALLKAEYDSKRRSVSIYTDETGKCKYMKPLPKGLWRGEVVGKIKIKISSEPADKLAKRLADIEKTIKDDNVPNDRRISALKGLAGEKHYFAARLVLKIWKQSREPALNRAALRMLIDLLDFGTAYEALPDLLDVLADPDSPAESRLRILDILEKARLMGWAAGIPIGKQGFYGFPPKLTTRARELVRKLANGRNPTLAVKARKIMASDD